MLLFGCRTVFDLVRVGRKTRIIPIMVRKIPEYNAYAIVYPQPPIKVPLLNVISAGQLYVAKPSQIKIAPKAIRRIPMILRVLGKVFQLLPFLRIPMI
jgi:hypothetical protein